MKDDAQSQKSEVHETTDDAGSSPANTARHQRDPRAPDEDREQRVKSAPDVPPASNFERGAADADIQHARDADVSGTSPTSDRENQPPDELFPPGTHVRKDESDFGGPIDVTLDDDSQGPPAQQ